MNPTWKYFIACSISRMRYVTYVFMPKQRNGGHLDFTNQSLGSFTDLCQLLFKHLLLFEPVNVALWYVIDCSLADHTDLNVWIWISPGLKLREVLYKPSSCYAHGMLPLKEKDFGIIRISALHFSFIYLFFCRVSRVSKCYWILNGRSF